MTAAKRRMLVALAAVPGLFVSLYLLLYKLGFYGTLACGQGGSCSVVQASSYASFLGVPVAGWGAAWYLAVLGVSLWGAHGAGSAGGTGGRRAGRASLAGPGGLLLALAAAGFVFSVYLTWVELFVIEAVCRWCLVSAGLSVVILGLAAPEAGALLGRPEAGGSPAGDRRAAGTPERQER